MMSALPAVLTAYMALLAAIPWAPRELGWYAADMGLRVSVLAPMSRLPRTVPNGADAPVAERPVDAANLNRAHGFVVALIVALLPYWLAVVLSPPAHKPWDLAKQALRSLG
jgi:hypothetical protein